MSVIVKLLSKFDNSGIKKAQHGFGGLKKTLAGIGLGIGVSQIANTLYDAAKAAQADNKSQALLGESLKRNAKATPAQIAQNEKFIQGLANQVGVIDDELRPALGDLTRSTHNVKDAQKLLKISFDSATMKGKSVTAVESAIAKAYNGSTSALSRMFPELKSVQREYENSHGKVKKLSDATAVGALMIKKLAKESKGLAEQQKTPFDTLNVVMDNLKEKLGAAILPAITNLVTEITKPGGLVEQVGKFLDDVSNPKTEPGKMFEDIKNAVKDAFGYVKDFFALFGNGDAMKGFGNVAGALVKMLPALIALKGIMMLANAGKTIANLVKAMTLIGAGNAAGGGGVTPLSKFTKNGMLSVAVRYAIPLAVTIATLDVIDAQFSNPKNRKKLADQAQNALKPSKFMPKAVNGIFVDKNGYDSAGNFVGKTVGGGASSSPGLLSGKTKGDTFTTYITVNSTNADPKAVVDAVSKYVKTNGGVPSAWGLSTQFHGSGR